MVIGRPGEEVRRGWESEVTELLLETIKVSCFVLADCTN